MKKRFFCFFTAFILLGAVVLTSCAQGGGKRKYTAYSMDYFDTVISITGYAESQAEFDSVANGMIEKLGEYHRLYDIYNRFEGMENLCTINELEGGEHRIVTVDQRIIDMLVYAKQMYTLTDGMMNVAMGSVLSLWHDYRSVGKDNPTHATLPPMDKLKAAAQHTDISKIIIDEQARTVTLADPLMKLDVGAIAKGYATECVAREYEQSGVTGYVLNVGGNVRTLGSKADGSKWTIGIENPDGGDYFAYLELDGQSLVTSGSYQRFYYVGDKAYHHIIHPSTLMPATGYLSVSVVCNNSAMADALSTALFCLPQSEGLELIEKTEGAEAMWVSDGGQKSFSSGWADYEK